MLKVVDKQSDLDKLTPMFAEIRFYSGRAVLQKTCGTAYADDPENPKFAMLRVGSFCHISGVISDEQFEAMIPELKNQFVVPSEGLIPIVERYAVVATERYSLRKDPCFDRNVLQSNIDVLDKTFELVTIDEDLADRIMESRFLRLSNNYAVNGIGCCCMHNGQIVGVASSCTFYTDGIEVNIRVKDDYQRRGIAAAMASKLILMCLDKGKTVSWDAMNKGSLALAEKLGFVSHSSYRVFKV